MLFIGEEEIDDDDSDEEFHYPGSTPPASGRPPSTRSSTTATTDYFSRQASTSRGPTDLTPHLSQAPEFRVPTHEAPQKVLSPRHTPTPHQVHATWERDEAVTQCRDCRRRFTFILRRVRTICNDYVILWITDCSLTARKTPLIRRCTLILIASLALSPLRPDILRPLFLLSRTSGPVRDCVRPCLP